MKPTKTEKKNYTRYHKPYGKRKHPAKRDGTFTIGNYNKSKRN